MMSLGNLDVSDIALPSYPKMFQIQRLLNTDKFVTFSGNW